MDDGSGGMGRGGHRGIHEWRRVMALCSYCNKVEIAWNQVDRRWIACHAQRNADGSVAKAAVRSGTRTIMRPVPDPSLPHYPVPAITGGTLSGFTSYCPEWTPAK